MAIRAALGGSRLRIVAQLLIKSLALAVAGGALGLPFGYAGLRALMALNPGNIPRIGQHGSAVTLDWRVLAFTLVISLSPLESCLGFCPPSRLHTPISAQLSTKPAHAQAPAPARSRVVRSW